MSEETDMKCPNCGLELPGPPGQYNVCGHCRSKIFWMNGKPIKRPLLTDKPVVIEPRSPITYEPPKVPEEDLKRIEEKKKRKDQEELERLLRNARREEEEARREALREAVEAKRKALREEEEAKYKAHWEAEAAKHKARREEEEAKRKALWEEQRPLREEEERKQRARLRKEKIKQSRKAIAEIFSFFVLLLILCSIPAFLNLIPTALTQFDELIQKLIDYLSLL